MRRNAVITVPQLFGMLFISRMVVNITYNPYMSSNGDLTDHLLSAVISYFLTFLLLIPVYLLYRKRKDMTVADYSYFLFGNYAVGIILLYAAYYLLVSCSTLSLFNTFVSNVMDPKVPIWGLSIAVMVTALGSPFIKSRPFITYSISSSRSITEPIAIFAFSAD